MDSEQNLLYGFLAWRSGFVSRDELLRSVKAWTHDRSWPLAKVLVESKVLTEARGRLVAGLVEEHLAQHRGDAKASLSAMEDSSLREELACILSGDGHQTLPQFSATLPGNTERDEAVVAEGPSATQPSAMRFQILRPHARGALGEVFVARDEELNRDVALKRIREHHVDTPQNRARFLLEAEVTGGLEHPGIVPVYSLGTSDDGRPFYAMRLIKGRSLREAIDDYHAPEAAHRDPGTRQLQLRQLLDRFMAVCNAIEYAHSRGVLHRDLKPENIMLGAYGETLVVDWGLAKPLAGADRGQHDIDRWSAFDDELPTSRADGAADVLTGPTLTVDEPLWRPSASSSATQMGSAIGTPAYMSPEQAAGQLDDIGPSSDVYSLGATLYCLLTGQPPFNDSDLGQLLDRVRRGDFPSPRAINRAVPAALEAVCLKAMALDPAERYSSPRAVAEDIERWLADEPVTAYGAPWHERLAHWARRHRRGVQSGVAALAMVSAVSVAAALLVHSAKLQVERERIAEREAKNEARRAIDNFVNLVTEEEALNDGRLRHLRQRLLADALKYYEELIDKHGGEEHLRHELAGAILRVAKINHDAGSKAEALKAFQEALKLFEDLARQYHDQEQYQSELALAYRGVGLLEGELGRGQEALEYLRQAVEVRQRLLEQALGARQRFGEISPAIDRYQIELGDAWYDLAKGQASLGHLDDALESFRQALKTKQALVERQENNFDYRSALATALENVGRALHAVDRDLEARASCQQAVAEQQRAVDGDPQNARYRELLAQHQRVLAELWPTAERGPAAADARPRGQ